MVVVGGGAGGLTAAREANRRGARTLLVHDGPLGGDCTHTGCVPSTMTNGDDSTKVRAASSMWSICLRSTSGCGWR